MQLAGVDAESLIASLSETAKERLSEGASGAFFFFSKDGKYIVKTTSKQEYEALGLSWLVAHARLMVMGVPH